MNDHPLLFRSTDPATSREAARKAVESGLRNEQQIEAFRMVWQNPGLTAVELEQVEGAKLNQFQLCRRLPELRSLGVVRNLERRMCRVNGTSMQTWEAVEVPTAGGRYRV